MTQVEEVTGEEMDVIDVSGDANALAVLNRSEIDMQISTAKKYPRSIARAKNRMIEMATLDRETAEKCGYALQRKDKNGGIAWIEGPSIRMAEIAVSCWGNIRYGARIIEEGDKFIVAQGVCHDLETNVYNAIEVRRRITGRSGRKYGDDMIGVTANAACAIAARNAVFKVVPLAIINAAYKEAMKTAEGAEGAKPMAERRKGVESAFGKLGVSIEEVMTVLGKPNGGLEDIDTTDLRRLRGLLTAINDNETTVVEVFRPKSEADAKADQLNERLRQQAEKLTVGNRPLSTGQRIEPNAEEVQRVADTLKAGQGNDAPSDPPDAPPANEAVEHGDEGGTPEDWSNWDAVANAVEGAAIDAGKTTAQAGKALNAELLRIRMKGKHLNTTPEQRAGIVAAVRSAKYAWPE